MTQICDRGERVIPRDIVLAALVSGQTLSSEVSIYVAFSLLNLRLIKALRIVVVVRVPIDPKWLLLHLRRGPLFLVLTRPRTVVLTEVLVTSS